MYKKSRTMTYKTDHVGVRHRRESNTYVAQMQFKGKMLYKSFPTYKEAVEQREAWEQMRDECNAEEEKQKLIEQEEQRLCTENCRDCKYGDVLSWFRRETVLHCQYYVMTGKRRPCYAGDNCIVKVKKAPNHAEMYRKYVSDTFYFTPNHRKPRVNRNLEEINYGG